MRPIECRPSAVAVLLGLLVLGFVIAVVGTAIRIHQGMDEARRELQRDAERLRDALDHELDIDLQNLRAMQLTAERFLIGRSRGSENPISRLRPVPGREAYESVLPASVGDPRYIGRITGVGPIPELDDPVAREMAMVIGMNPIMRALRERDSAVPWIQYASARRFMFIFPQAGAETFHFEASLLERDYFARATPAANPDRRHFWSGPYEDAVGLGRIVTVSQPIDDGDVFLGSLSIDVLVVRLGERLSSIPITGADVSLLGEDEALIARVSDDEDDAAEHLRDAISLPLANAPWTLRLDVSRRDLLLQSLRERTWHLVALLVLGLTLGFSVVLAKQARRIRELSIRDGLTGLHNRRYFDEVAPRLFDAARRDGRLLGLALLDIDYFKKYNDTYGHPQGDVALREVAKAISGALRRGGDHAFRVGGEEFAVIVSLKDAEELVRVMAAINAAVRALGLPHAAHPAGHVTVSIGGVAVGGGHVAAVDAAYRRADEALYDAKSGGRDRAVHVLMP